MTFPHFCGVMSVTVLEKHPSADDATRQYGLFCALFLRVKILFGFLLGYKCIY